MQHAKYVLRENPEYSELEPEEVIVLTILAKDLLPEREIFKIFGHVKTEKKLKEPVARFFKDQNYKVFQEIEIGKSRADLVGYKPGLRGLGREIVAIELKVNPNEMKRFLDQVTDYQAGADKVYLGTTPYTVLKYLLKYGKRHFDPDILESKLEKVGVGLIIVDLTNREEPCRITIKAQNTETKKKIYEATIEQCETAKPFI